MMNALKSSLVLTLFVAVSALPLHAAARKTIYLKPFAVVQGLPAADPSGTLIKDYISEEIISAGTYTIVSDDEVRQVIASEELKMSLDACYDDSCIKKLMESIKTDYIIYGNVSFLDEKFYITAKILDRTSGTIVLARVKTIKFRKRDNMERGSKALGDFLVEGRDERVKEFESWIVSHETDREQSTREVITGRKDNILTRAALFRIGYGFSTISDSQAGTLYDSPMFNAVFDTFLWRDRNRDGNGFDIFMRATMHATNWNHDKIAQYKELNPDIPATATAPDDTSSTLGFLGMGPGIRFIKGTCFLGVQLQVYVLAAYQYTIRVSGSEMEYKMGDELRGVPNDIDRATPIGCVGAAGLELSFSPYVGAFAELAYGYNQFKAWGKTRNLDGRSVFMGLTLRSSFLD
jgi:hypothetical protein